jgi:clan AA aspartic protease (TIGR02281 family)
MRVSTSRPIGMHMTARRISRTALYLVLVFCGSAHSESVPLVNDRGTLQVPVLINGKSSYNFTIDSGASDVCIPANIFYALTMTGTVSQRDYLDKRTYKLADGTTEYSQRFRVRSMRVGSLELHDVIASVVPTAGSLLLGQSFLSRLKSWSIDNERRILAIVPSNSAQASFVTPVLTNLNGRSGWVRLSSLRDPAGALYVDTTSFKGTGNLRWFSEKQVFPSHTEHWLGKWVNYSLSQWEFNCSDERAKLGAKSDTYEDGTLWVADAKLLASTAWHPIQGDSWKEGEMKLVCGWTSPRASLTK